MFPVHLVKQEHLVAGAVDAVSCVSDQLLPRIKDSAVLQSCKNFGSLAGSSGSALYSLKSGFEPKIQNPSFTLCCPIPPSRGKQNGVHGGPGVEKSQQIRL